MPSAVTTTTITVTIHREAISFLAVRIPLFPRPPDPLRGQDKPLPRKPKPALTVDLILPSKGSACGELTLRGAHQHLPSTSCAYPFFQINAGIADYARDAPQIWTIPPRKTLKSDEIRIWQIPVSHYSTPQLNATVETNRNIGYAKQPELQDHPASAQLELSLARHRPFNSGCHFHDGPLA